MAKTIWVVLLSYAFGLSATNALAESLPSSGDSPIPADAARQMSEQRMTDPHAKGRIDFETFRMLSTGMTEGEVLGRAGAPWHTYAITCDFSVFAGVSCPRRWVYAMDNEWMVEVTFFRGQVLNINHFRTRP